MHLGIFTVNAGSGLPIADLARAAEERGLESLWVGEHTHIPACRTTPYPGGGELPAPYYEMRDPFVSLMAAGAATRALRLGTAVALLTQRSSITLAKEAATLDVLTGGRLILGVGAGWNAEEMENHGTPFARRFAVLRERVSALKVLWTEDEASHHGEFERFDRVISRPKPFQKPHPPILMGGATRQARERAVRYCDGWLPIDSLADDLVAGASDLRRLSREAGRDPESIAISVCAFRPFDPDDIHRYRDLGVARAIVLVSSRPRSALEQLDRLARLTNEVA